MTTTMTSGLAIDVIHDTDGFRELEHEWRDLYDASPAATPFQTWEWLFTWWEVYGTRGALRLITARHDGRLVGVLPLMATKPGHLQFIGTGLSDHLDVLIDTAHTEDVLSGWIVRLRGSRLRLLDLQEVRPEATVWELHDRWPARRGHHPQSECAEFDIAPLEDMLASWSRNARKNARLAMNRVAKAGYTEHWATPDDVGDMAETLVREHQQMWAGRGISPSHAEARFVVFIRVACERMARHGQVGLVRLDAPEGADDPMTLHNLMFIGRAYVGGYLSAYNDTARRRMTVAMFENIQGIELANRLGIGVMSMLRGMEDGKTRAYDRNKVNHRLLLAGQGARATGVWLRRTIPVSGTAWLKNWEKQSEKGAAVTAFLRSIRDRISS